MREIEVGHFIQWGRLFGIDDAATRVAVGRLLKHKLIKVVTRGTYTMGPEGRVTADAASSWVLAEKFLGPWSGDWLIVHTSHLARTNKTALRSRERVFRFYGFAEYVSGLWCRPANYLEPTIRTRDRLVSLGLDPLAVVMRVSETPGIEVEELFKLWPRNQIEMGYKGLSQAMKVSSRRLNKLTIEEAARETFLVGEAVIRQINSDPLLPDPMINTGLRRSLIEQMIQYDNLGRQIWASFEKRCATAE